MTRLPNSIVFNNWHDAEQVDISDMQVEQNRNIQTDAAIINNHFGSGILPGSLIQNIIFDSDNLDSTQASILAAGNFDGTGLSAQSQPSDTNLGNQLEVSLTGTSAFGRLSTKVVIIGLDFQENTQYERFVFYKNEKQVSRKHYAQVLTILFNDFKGNNNCSRDLGGQIVISEATSFELSRDTVMVAQDVEPNLFFRDFKVSNPAITLYNTIQAGMGSVYTVDSLDINTTVLQNRQLLPNDVSSKIGIKFQATTNNIQKITMLLGAVADDSVPLANEFDWTGDIIISIWALQTTVSCPTDIIPELAIDFDPNQFPLAQLSFAQDDLKDLGYVLNDVLQPVDFVFNTTNIAATTNSIIVPGNFYAITISRAGAANTGTIFTGSGTHSVDNARLTLFNGVWVDVPEEDMWFQIWTNAAKVSDGQAYDGGNGIQLQKTIINSIGAQVDYSLNSIQLVDAGQNNINIAIVQAIQNQTDQEQDERTGDPIYVRQQFEPQISFLTQSGLTSLKSVSEPIIIGCAEDINPRQNSLIQKNLILPGLANGDVLTVVAPDADLISNNIIGSKLVPNTLKSTIDYRIFKATICTDGYGDVNGDGTIDVSDITRASILVGESFYYTSTQTKIVDGDISILELLRADVDGDGYITTNDVLLITQYVARTINAFPVGSSFRHMDITVQESIGRFDGYYDCDGYVRIQTIGGTTIVSPSSLDPSVEIYDGYLITPSINGSDNTFSQIPFQGVIFQIISQPFWQDYMVVFSSEARVVPASFTSEVAVVVSDCAATTLLSCANTIDVVPQSDPGRNDIMFPDNIILRRGQILNPDGSNYRIDFEIGQIILELPEIQLSEATINIFDKFVIDVGGGFTKSGYPCMRFSDCTTVGSDALLKNQVKFDVAIQAFNFNADGYDDVDGYSVIVNEGIRALIDPTTGILTLTVNDLSVDPVFRTRISKIQIIVYMKKGGFVNNTITITSDQIAGLISA